MISLKKTIAQLETESKESNKGAPTQDGKPQAERQHDAWRKRAGAVDVGNGEPNDRRARARQAARG